CSRRARYSPRCQGRCDVESVREKCSDRNEWNNKRVVSPSQPGGCSVKLIPALQINPDHKFLHDLRVSETGYCSWKKSGSFGKQSQDIVANLPTAIRAPKHRWAAATVLPFAPTRAETRRPAFS